MLKVKLTLRSKLFLSFSLVILATLTLLSYLVESQLSAHVQTFFKSFDGKMMSFPERPEEVFLETVERSILLTVIGAASISMVLSFILTDYITRPVKKVIEATKAISMGRYEERVPVESNDELSDMCHSLNSMADALEKHRYLQRQLITNVSHELATPLTSIGGYLEALSDDLIDESKRRVTYDLMQEEVVRLGTMISEVRSLSLLEEPRFRIQRNPCNVKDLTEKIIQEMSPQFNEKEVNVKFKSLLTKEDHSIDKDRYTQILINLLSNALKYSPNKNPVEITLEEANDGFILRIEDHGQGIPKKELPYIFERFYRADQSRNRKTGGIGIGLAIVKELVEAHGGSITVKSTENEGTLFTVFFRTH